MKARRAVTLVELLIVVFIIGAMSFVAIPIMSMSTVTRGKVETTTQKIASAIRYTRSLAISNAATNSKGYSLEMTGANSKGGGYTGYSIVNLGNNKVVRSETIDSGVTCTGADDFDFGTLGQRTGDTDSLVIESAEQIFNISVVSATGMVKCVEK